MGLRVLYEPLPLFLVLTQKYLLCFLRHRCPSALVLPLLDQVFNFLDLLAGEMVFQVFSIARVPV